MRKHMIWHPATIVALFLLGAVAIGGSARSVSGSSEEVLSFDMWCLEMQLLPAARCDSRRPADLKDYQKYRTSVEQYQRRQRQQDERERAIKDKLNRDPINSKRDPLQRPG
jgi:hypothetical protein